MAQTSRVQGRATSVFTDEGALCVRYHSTVVAKRNADGTTTLDSGGWHTNTTKIRINQFANQHCGGAFQVAQRDFAWFVQFRDTNYNVVREMSFADGITFAINKE